MLTAVVQLNVHEAGENEAVAPVGSPDAENVTDVLLPEARAAVMEF